MNFHTLKSVYFSSSFIFFSYFLCASSKDKVLENSLTSYLPKDSRLSERYDELFPYYVTYCALSKYTAQSTKEISGSVAGHGVYYLKGVCKNYSDEPSGIKLCDSNMDFSNPNLGVGISVDKGFKNGSYLVIPGRDDFFGNYLKTEEVYDGEKREEIVERLFKGKLFDHIKFYDEMFPKVMSESKKRYLIRYTLGSDHHLSLGRHLF